MEHLSHNEYKVCCLLMCIFHPSQTGCMFDQPSHPTYLVVEETLASFPSYLTVLFFEGKYFWLCCGEVVSCVVVGDQDVRPSKEITMQLTAFHIAAAQLHLSPNCSPQLIWKLAGHAYETFSRCSTYTLLCLVCKQKEIRPREGFLPV